MRGHRCAGFARCRVLFSALLFVGLLIGGLLPAAPVAHAATLTVNSLADSGGSCPATCTLRAALDAAQPGDTITFGVTGTIPLGSMLSVTKNVTIQGPGASKLALDGQNAVRIMEIAIGVSADISGLAIQNGSSTDEASGITSLGTLTLTNLVLQHNTGLMGAGILIRAGQTTVTDSTIRDNTSGLDGGGIRIELGVVTVTNSTVSGNSGSAGGGISVTGGLLFLTNSTLSGNNATTGGGLSVDSDSFAELKYVTITANTAGTYGGIRSAGATTRPVLLDSIVGGNTSTHTPGNCDALVDSDGSNLSDTSDCFVASPGNGDLVSPTLGLGPLADNGGPTMTHALHYDSPAVDGVPGSPSDCAAPVTDQRGVPRPQVGGNSRCDTGAFELEGNPPVIGSIGPQTIAEDGTLNSLPLTLSDADNDVTALTVSVTSSNQAIVPNGNIAVGGSGALRLLTITPLSNQNGTVDITVTASDGLLLATQPFTLTITPANDDPVNTVPSTPPALTVNQNGSLVFSSATGNQISVADVDAGSSPVQVDIIGDNGSVTLHETTGLTVIAGADGSPSVTVTGPFPAINTALNGVKLSPTPGYTGSASLRLITNDLGNTGTGGPKLADTTIPITVQPFNATPTITGLSDRFILEDTSATVSFTVADEETPASALVVTATSGNQALLPSGGIELSGTDAARTLRLTPAANQNGTSQVDVTVTDGAASVHVTFNLGVTLVNDPPVAINDSYSTVANQALTVPAADAVLKNDTDIDTGHGGLTAVKVADPAHGTLSLAADGGFTYTPVPGFAGTDSFTYRTSDGPASSAPATVTIAVAPSPCMPRPRVTTAPVAGGGRLTVHVESTPLNTPANNPIRSLTFGPLQNARVTLNGQTIASGQSFAPPTSATAIDFTVERVTPGQATTVPFTLVDGCGEWTSLVGGGAAAGF
jgi:CSLREA domain-containing protein